MTAQRLIELAPEIDELLNISPDELEKLGESACPNFALKEDWNKLTAWSICNSLARMRRGVGKIHGCLQRNHIGLGGESIFDLITQVVDSFYASKKAEASLTSPERKE